MIKINKVESIDQLGELKKMYMGLTTAPLDGMWLCGFVPMASHFGFYEDEKLVGYCCVNDEGFLLQFYISPQFQDQSSDVFELIIKGENSPVGKVSGAFVSTAEPEYLSLCLDSFPGFKVNALMYQLDQISQLDETSTSGKQQNDPTQMTVVKYEQLSELVDFAVDSIGAPEEWLTGYYTNLINRQELLGHWQDGELIAAGECRGYDEYQTDYADLGVIVHKSQRRKGLATKVLSELVNIAESKGLNPICSTEKGNIGAQKAIVRAGFFAGNRIIRFDI